MQGNTQVKNWLNIHPVKNFSSLWQLKISFKRERDKFSLRNKNSKPCDAIGKTIWGKWKHSLWKQKEFCCAVILLGMLHRIVCGSGPGVTNWDFFDSVSKMNF